MTNVPGKKRTGRWRDRINPAPRPRRCPGPECNTKIERNRFACGRHWRQLPEELRKTLAATIHLRQPDADLPRDHPYRVAAREARTIWNGS